MDMNKYKEYAPILVRVAMSLVFLWFGLNQVFDSASWVGWLPQWAYSIPISPATLIILNGTFEVIFGTFLLLGLFTRISALLLTLHLLGITISIGYNDVGIRDLGLTLATFSVFMYGMDQFCLDNKRKR
jgi:uncharacterized membrane protein YphA (DoxX/SURF4 family)